MVQSHDSFQSLHDEVNDLVFVTAFGDILFHLCESISDDCQEYAHHSNVNDEHKQEEEERSEESLCVLHSDKIKTSQSEREHGFRGTHKTIVMHHQLTKKEVTAHCKSEEIQEKRYAENLQVLGGYPDCVREHIHPFVELQELQELDSREVHDERDDEGKCLIIQGQTLEVCKIGWK